MNNDKIETSSQIRPRSTEKRKIARDLLATYGTKCAYCGIDFSFGTFCVDAYYPRASHPVPPIENNNVLACFYCNAVKGAKEPVDENGAIRILHPYNSQYWSEIKINRDGIAVGQTDSGSSTIDIMRLNRPELVEYRQNHIGDYIDKIIDGTSACEVYKCSIAQLKELLQLEMPNATLQEYFHRMVYANVIASMEAYLSKTFISLVLNDNDIFWRFVNRFDWNKEKVCIENIKEVYDSMNLKVQTKLADVLYHNLPKVRAMYQKILEITILQDESEMTFLTQAVDIRHDLVHRNGRKNNSGTADEYHSISINMINELISHVNLLIDDIERQLN